MGAADAGQRRCGGGGIVEQEMREATSKLEFERAAHLRDQIATLKNASPVVPPQKKVKYPGKMKSTRSR
jgi:hypothetical protein